MVRRDVNHPSISSGTTATKAAGTPELDGEFAKWDPQQRHVLHPQQTFRGVDTNHYPQYAALTQRVAGQNVYMPTEFLHGLFDGGLGRDRGLLGCDSKSKVTAGGFLWAFLDETVKRRIRAAKWTAGNHAPDGIVGPYREKEGSYFTVKQVWSPIVMSRNDNVLTIENR